MNQDKRLIAVVGMPGAGKSIVTRYLTEKLAAPKVRFGDVADEELEERGLEFNLENDRKVRESLRKELGMAAFAIKSLPKIESGLKTNDVAILDGLYSWEEYLFLSDKFKNITLVTVFAPSWLRYSRVVGRRVRTLKNFSEVRSRDIAELSNLNKGGPIAFADYMVMNNSSLKRVYGQIDRILIDLSLKKVS